MTIRKTTFTPEQCSLRLRRLQALCKKLELDALLFIPGIDGSNNPGSTEAVGYLLEGRCGRDVLDLGRLSSPAEDVVLLIGPSNVGMYATPAAYKAFWPLLAPCWSNLDLRCATSEEAEDPDSLDECKIGTFVQLLHGIKKVGIALTPTSGGQPGNPMEVEQWALIQAYGLEGVGRLGFFSMNFEVVDIFQHLQELYTEMDGHGLDHLLRSNVELMLQHWGEVVQGISIVRPAERSKLSERQVGEPLLSYYAYGTLRPTAGVKQVLTMMPRVVFGSRTGVDTEQSSTLTLAAAVKSGEPCPHFVVEAADPKSALRVARTYFFSCGALPSNCLTEATDEFFGTEKDAKELAGWSDGGVPHLMRLYCALSEAAKVAIRHFALGSEATAQTARRAAVSALMKATERFGIPLSADAVASQLRFALWGSDHTNAVIPAPPRGSRVAKVLRLSLHDIKDRDGKDVGALVYADTFVEGFGGPGCDPIILTQAVPSLLCFPATSSEVVAINRLEGALRSRLAPVDIRPSTASRSRGEDGSRIVQGLDGDDTQVHLLKAPDEGEKLGDLIGSGEEEVLILTGCEALPSVKGHLSCFAGGLVLRTRMFPPLVLDFRTHLEGLWLQDYGDEGRGSVIVLRGKSPGCSLLPVSLLCTGCCLGIALDSLRVIARRHVTRVVIPTWEQACREMDIPIGDEARVAAFPEELEESQVANVHWASKSFSVNLPDTKVLEAFAGMDAAAAAASSTPTTPLATALALGEGSGVGIVLVTGLPGSHQEEVASALVEFESSGFSWQVVQVPLSCGASLSCEALDAPLTRAVQEAAAKSTANSAPRVAIVAECFDGLSSQIDCLAATRACTSSSAWLCSTVVCCNSVLFDDPRRTAPPGYLEQLQPGLVDSVVLCGPHDRRSVTDMLQLRLPGVPVIRSARGQLLRSLDTLLSTSRPKDQAAKACQAPWPISIRRISSGKLKAVYIKCTGSLDMAAFSQQLQRLGIRESNRCVEPTPMQDQSLLDVLPQRVLVIRGLIRTDVGGEIQALTGISGTAERVGRWPLAAVLSGGRSPATHLLEGDQPGAELLFVGSGLLASQIRAVVESAAPAPLGCAPSRDLASLAKAERQSVAKAHEGLDLPDGYYYDGTSYLDPFGDRLTEHPSMGEFLDRYLAEVNESIAARNMQEVSGGLKKPLEVVIAEEWTISTGS